MDKKTDLYSVDPGTLDWRMSSLTGNDSNCVELAPLPNGGFAVRDSKNPERGFLAFDAGEKAAFKGGLDLGEFDDLLG
ncbi:DUF397 domain-containing protein [Streptacidiphilus sp. 4-A2]|nr:DUF397 domain-containing protein [Streptacidiphilus sp. 4-A2]